MLKTSVKTLSLSLLLTMCVSTVHAGATNKERELDAEIVEKQINKNTNSTKKNSTIKSSKKSKSNDIGFFKLLIPGTIKE